MKRTWVRVDFSILYYVKLSVTPKKEKCVFSIVHSEITVLDIHEKYKWVAEKGIYIFLIVTLSILEKDKLVRVMNNGNMEREFSCYAF